MSTHALPSLREALHFVVNRYKYDTMEHIGSVLVVVAAVLGSVECVRGIVLLMLAVVDWLFSGWYRGGMFSGGYYP